MAKKPDLSNNPRIQKIDVRLAEIVAEQEAILVAADEAGGNLSDEQAQQFDALDAERDTLLEKRDREERLQIAKASAKPAKTYDLTTDDGGDDGQRTRITRQRDLECEAPFESFGHQLKAVYEASLPGRNPDPRLFYNQALGGAASVPSDGGYLIRSEFSQEILRRMFDTSVLASRCSRAQISDSNDGLELVYVDEHSRVDGARWGGVRVYRSDEAHEVEAHKPKLANFEIKLEDITGLAYMTNRLLRDAAAMTSIYQQAFADEFAFKIDSEIFNGNGHGRIEGFMNSGALVTVPKETGQAAGTIKYENLLKMRARRFSRNTSRYVWLINQDCEPQLHTMSLPVGTGGVPVYLPANGAADSPFDRLFGQPVIPIEQAESVGSLGDIAYVDLSQMLLIEKDGLQADTSIHVAFITHQTAFRWIMRINGKPMPHWQKPLTPHKGSATQSPFITLAART